jgi:hypothetical protein
MRRRFHSGGTAPPRKDEACDPHRRQRSWSGGYIGSPESASQLTGSRSLNRCAREVAKGAWAYSVDLRERVVRASEVGEMTDHQVATLFGSVRRRYTGGSGETERQAAWNHCRTRVGIRRASRPSSGSWCSRS